MTDTNGTGLNLLQFHIKEECSPINIKIEEVNEEIIKTETKVFEGSWVNQNVDIHELLANDKQNLENSEGQLLNENADIKNEAFEDDPKICEKINNLSTNRQKPNEIGMEFGIVSMDFDGEEKVSQHDLIENTKRNNKKEKEKSKFLHDDNDYFRAGTLKKRVPVPQKKCEKDVALNYAECKKRKSERNAYYTTEKKYKCNECSFAAKRKHELLVHIQFRHSTEKPYTCTECCYASVLKRQLLSHIKFHHTMEKPYTCNECSYATVQKHSLIMHIKSCHTKEKPYKCNECSYAALQKRNLLFHIKSHHLMEKPYKCKECSFAAVRKHELLVHIQSRHSMEKPYKCDECSYAAVKKNDLLSHIKSCHSMEKPYKCNECSYAAVRKGSLLSHIKFRHTIKESYKCNECSYEAPKESNLVVHMKSRHTIQKPEHTKSTTSEEIAQKPPNLEMLRMFL